MSENNANEETKETAVFVIEGVTSSMVEVWKAKNPNREIKKAVLSVDEKSIEQLEILVAVPSRHIIGEFEKWTERNPNKAKEIMIKGCVLFNQERILAEDYLFYGAFDACVSLMPVAKSIIKNL